MGDVAMTVPVIRAFAAQYPDVKITFVSRPFFKPFFDDIPNLEFFTFDAKGRHKGFLGLIRLFKDLKKYPIDAFADLHNVVRSKVVRTFFALSGKKVAFVDKGRAEKKALTRAENKIFKPVASMFERHVKVFQELGFAVSLSNPVFPDKPNLDQETLKVVGEKKQHWIGIAPFAQYDSKVYPQDLMQEVINTLAADPSNKILLFGGGDKEIQVLNQFAAGKENVVVIAGKISFKQELQLISNLDVMLSMDSGNAHIAAMLGIKVITLWGATHPYAGFLPFNQGLESALVSDREQFPKLPTSVYGNKKVAGYEEAMRSIKPKEVIAAVNSNLRIKA
jgi:ADP-heptose:LPS heptosyltransferase